MKNNNRNEVEAFNGISDVNPVLLHGLENCISIKMVSWTVFHNANIIINCTFECIKTMLTVNLNVKIYPGKLFSLIVKR